MTGRATARSLTKEMPSCLLGAMVCPGLCFPAMARGCSISSRQGVSEGSPAANSGSRISIGATAKSCFPASSSTATTLSGDSQSITYSSIGPDGAPHAWIARLDRRSPPRQLSIGEALGPVFGHRGCVYYRAPENGEYFIFEHDPASGTVRKVTSEPAVNAPSVTPDGQWLLSTTPVSGDDAAVVRFYPVDGGSPVEFCTRCFPKWTSDGREMFFSLSPNNGMGIGFHVRDRPVRRPVVAAAAAGRDPFSGRLEGTARKARDRTQSACFPVPLLTSLLT